MRNVKRRSVLVLVLPLTLVLGGCGTIAGIGRDIQSMSQWTQEKLDNGFDNKGEDRLNYAPGPRNQR